MKVPIGISIPPFPLKGSESGLRKKKQVKTLSDIQALDAEHQKHRKEKKPAEKTPSSSNRFNNFRQREYDFDEYEKQLLAFVRAKRADVLETLNQANELTKEVEEKIVSALDEFKTVFKPAKQEN